MAEYHCSYMLIKRALLTGMSQDEYRDLATKRIGRPNSGRFPKGNIPWTKGVKGLRLSPATEFKCGHIRGMAARRYRAVGTITIRNDKAPKRLRERKNAKPGKPRRYIKVRDDGPLHRRYQIYARYVYEQEYGPIPAGLIVLHKDGDTMNDDPGNLLAVTHASSLNHMKDLDPNLEHIRLKQLRKSQKDRRAEERVKREKYGKRVRIYECQDCGYDSEDKLARCPKCSSFRIDPVKVRIKQCHGRTEDGQTEIRSVG
jgi:predicted Zn-ribbon and HTH transcriptional regulator